MLSLISQRRPCPVYGRAVIPFHGNHTVKSILSDTHCPGSSRNDTVINDYVTSDSFVSSHSCRCRGADRPGDVTRPAYGAGGRLLVLGSKIRDTAASGNLATPVPVNTPSMRSENNGQDISVPLVPSGGVGWGANKQPASPPPVSMLLC